MGKTGVLCAGGMWKAALEVCFRATRTKAGVSQCKSKDIRLRIYRAVREEGTEGEGKANIGGHLGGKVEIQCSGNFWNL